jgi:hypothetical protein
MQAAAVRALEPGPSTYSVMTTLQTPAAPGWTMRAR